MPGSRDANDLDLTPALTRTLLARESPLPPEQCFEPTRLLLLLCYEATHGAGCPLSEISKGMLTPAQRSAYTVELYRKITGDMKSDATQVTRRQTFDRISSAPIVRMLACSLARRVCHLSPFPGAATALQRSYRGRPSTQRKWCTHAVACAPPLALRSTHGLKPVRGRRLRLDQRTARAS